jgi:hypothetical protein
MCSIRYLKCSAIALGAMLVAAALPAGAVTPEELTGDYRLSAVDIDYGNFPPPVDTGDFMLLRGYLAATGTVLVFDWFGIANGTTEYEQEEEGRYTLSGSRLVLTDAEGLTTEFGLAMPDADTVVLTGSARDDNNNVFDFTYEFVREATYYNQAQLDAAIADATAGLYTQAELDAAVQAALDSVEPEVIRQPVIIPLLD